MLKLNYRYDQNSARLIVEGLPDKSLGQSSDTIGILSSWQLDLVGVPTLEGNREHLETLMAVLLPYTRYYLSGIYQTFGEIEGLVRVSPLKKGHQIMLRSSKENVEPLDIQLDDAEFADLIYCLESFMYDKRVSIKWNIPEHQPLKRVENSNKINIVEKLTAPILGISSLLFVTSIFLLMFIPKSNDQSQDIGTQTKFSTIYTSKY